MKKIMNKKLIVFDNYVIVRSKVIINETGDRPEDRYERCCQKCGNPAYPECIVGCGLHKARRIQWD